MKYSNETMKLLYERGSVRAFEDKDIPEELLTEVINAGCHAATGGNLQPYSIIKIKSSRIKQDLMQTRRFQPIVKNAPVSLLFCIDWHRIERWAKYNYAPFIATKSYKHFWIAFQDTVIAAQSICTAADSVGLGSVYIGTVESCFDQLKPIFQLPNGVFPVVIVSLGYPKVMPKVAPKLLANTIVHDEVYSELPINELNKRFNLKYGDSRKAANSEQNLKTLYNVTERVEGTKMAKDAIEYANTIGKIHAAQRYFSLQYRADEFGKYNSDFIKSLKNYGFSWITGKNYPPSDDLSGL